jgi:hypothetical protein
MDVSTRTAPTDDLKKFMSRCIVITRGALILGN